MKKRLVDKYRVGDRVEIDTGRAQWSPAVVLEHDHPGLWVLDGSGKPWFVTNTGRIRRWQDAA